MNAKLSHSSVSMGSKDWKSFGSQERGVQSHGSLQGGKDEKTERSSEETSTAFTKRTHARETYPGIWDEIVIPAPFTQVESHRRSENQKRRSIYASHPCFHSTKSFGSDSVDKHESVLGVGSLQQSNSIGTIHSQSSGDGRVCREVEQSDDAIVLEDV